MSCFVIPHVFVGSKGWCIKFGNSGVVISAVVSIV